MRDKHIAAGITAVILVMAATLPSLAQPCPDAGPPDKTSEPLTLEGALIYHDDIRQWFELKLDQPQCGETSIQLLRAEHESVPIEALRGCRIRSRGSIGFAPTGYYTRNIYQKLEDVEPVGACVRQPPFPDYSKMKPKPSIRHYRVDMRIDYGPGDHPVIFTISSAGRELRPWQAYASYSLTGGFVLYGHCADGFVVDGVFGTTQANPAHFDEPRTPDDMAMFNPENAAAAGERILHLGYTCLRKP